MQPHVYKFLAVRHWSNWARIPSCPVNVRSSFHTNVRNLHSSRHKHPCRLKSQVTYIHVYARHYGNRQLHKCTCTCRILVTIIMHCMKAEGKQASCTYYAQVSRFFFYTGPREEGEGTFLPLIQGHLPHCNLCMLHKHVHVHVICTWQQPMHVHISAIHWLSIVL